MASRVLTYTYKQTAHCKQCYHSILRCTTDASAEQAFTSNKYQWRRQVGQLWRSIGMTNKDAEDMVQRGELKPLFRKYNILSVRLSELRELFPNANIIRMIKLMPSLLSDDIHKQLTDKRYNLDRSLLQFDIDRLISEHPFILTKDTDFIGRNKANLMELFGVNDTQFKIMIDTQPKIIMFDARRTISVKYQLIAQYFQKRIENDVGLLYKSYNNLESDNETDLSDTEDNESDNNELKPTTRKSLKWMANKANKTEKDKLKWTIIRNPELLCMGWHKFCRLEFVGNDKSLCDKKFAVNRLMELEAQRMLKKFPKYSEYLMARLESDGGCDSDKLEPLSIEELEEAMGELICLEHYPRSSEVDEQMFEDEEDEEEEEQVPLTEKLND